MLTLGFLAMLVAQAREPDTEFAFIDAPDLDVMQVLVEEGRTTAFFGGVSYREVYALPITRGMWGPVELVPQGETLVGSNILATRSDPRVLYGQHGDLVEVGNDEVLVEGIGWIWGTAHDVDGDGREDICGREFLVRTHSPDFLTEPYPNPTPFPPWGNHLCISDLNGDGHGELLQLHYFDIVPIGYDAYPTTTNVHLHLGGPDGYEATPAWSHTFEQAVHQAVPVQADADPELELLLSGGALRNGYDATTMEFQVLDAVQGPTPTVVLVRSDQQLDTPRRGTPAQLEYLGDLDGDGLDEVAVCTLSFHDKKSNPHGELRIIGAGRNFDTNDPIATFPLEAPRGAPNDPNPDPYDICSPGAQDLDGDGHVDLYAFATLTFSNQPSLFQVWYGPLYEAPEPLPDTADTGTLAATGDTGATTTASTADTEQPAAGPTGTSSPTEADKGGRCGCTTHTGLPLTMLFLTPLLWRRRCSS